MRCMQAQRCLLECESGGAVVYHGVDGTSLVSTAARAPFDRIIFNFPHTGLQRVHDNRALLAGFFESCECVP
jgi:hypothetical protein